jgi:hypothetical protein
MPSNQRPSFQNAMIGLIFVSGCRHYPRLSFSEALEEAPAVDQADDTAATGSRTASTGTERS